MTTTLTPPPAGAPGSDGQPPTRGASRVIAILVIAFGGLVILGTIFSALVSTIAAASVHTTTRTQDVSGLAELKVDVAAGSLRVEFADVSEAQLEVRSTWGADRWTLAKDGNALDVSSPQDWLGGGWPFGSWFGVNGVGEATLRLPRSMEGSDAQLALAAGELVVVDGSFGRVGLDMGAGRARIGASVEDISADVSAGTAELTLDGVRSGTLTVSAGSLQARMTGSQPDSLGLEVTAGTLDVAVPDGQYDVRSDVSAGQFDNRIGSVPGAASTITVHVSAGQAVLRAG